MDLTRRGLIGRALAGGGMLLARPRVALAGADGEAVFEMRVPGRAADAAVAARASSASGAGAGSAGSASGAGSPGRPWVSAPIDAGRRFELLGIEWTRDRDPGIQVRARGDDGRWSGWLDAPLAHGHGPDGAKAARLTDPVWTGPARVFQLRASVPLNSAKAVLVDSGAGAAHASAKRYVDSGLPAGPGQPRIIARSSWATAACKPREAAELGAVDLMFVHHTVSSNSYSAGQSAAMVRAICLFHKYGNGWNEIGYNFVVDRYGQIFEARAGGIDEPIVGAQAGGYNVYSSGVALLGNYAGAGPSRQAFDALSRLVAWKLSVHGVAVPGHVTVQVTRTGAPYSRYRAGARVRLNRIAGHRDADTTACPGNGMYRQLPRLRQVVSRLAPEVSSLSVQPAAAPAGAGIGSLTGVLTAAGTPIAGAPVELQRRTTGGSQTIATTTTGADGTWTATGALPRNGLLRAVYRGDDTRSAVVSALVAVKVAPQISLAAVVLQVPPGGVVDFGGAISPAKTKLSIVVSQQQPDGSFAAVRTIRFRAASDGTFARTIGFAAAGQYQVLAETAADDANAAGSSAPVAVTVA